MPNSAKLILQEVDQSFQVQSPLQGLNAVLLQTLRGPYGANDEIFTNEQQFRKVYGGDSPTLLGATQAIRALNNGSMLRVVKMGHYTTISDPTTLSAVKAAWDTSSTDYLVVAVGVTAARITMKYPGLDYNNLQLKITAADNGDSNYFNIEINHLLEPNLNEKYPNLTIPGTPTVNNSHYLDDIISKSRLINITYSDLSAQTAPLNPTTGTWLATGGSNGGAVVDNDYIGNSAGTGLHALDAYDDFECFSALDNESSAFLNAGGAYANGRQDCVFIGHLGISNTTVSSLTSLRTSLTIDTRYAYLINGGVKIKNPFITSDSPTPLNLPETGDVLGIAGASSAKFGPWWSFAGIQRGSLSGDVLGVVNNFAPGGSANLDLLAQKQINCVVSISGNIYIKGNFSAQKAFSRKSFMNVVKLIIYLKKTLRPTLERYLEQPNDFRNFREIYNEVKPFLDSLKGAEKRALIDYRWDGDQFANSDEDLKINSRANLDAGKYQVNLWLKEIVSLQEFTLSIISAPSGVSFSDNA